MLTYVANDPGPLTESLLEGIDKLSAEDSSQHLLGKKLAFT